MTFRDFIKYKGGITLAEIKSINELLNMNLDIPDYQRPYKWTIQNITDLLGDITNSIADWKEVL